MSKDKVRLRQLVDWRAVAWAGIVAGTVFLLFNLFLLPKVIGGNAWVILRLMASIGLGPGILAPPATFDLTALVVAMLIHFVISLAAAALIASVLHRWGLVVGIVGGAVIGLLLYGINIFSFTYFFPWLFALHTWTFAIAHVIFGAIAGGVYESLEVERFVSAS